MHMLGPSKTLHRWLNVESWVKQLLLATFRVVLTTPTKLFVQATSTFTSSTLHLLEEYFAVHWQKITWLLWCHFCGYICSSLGARKQQQNQNSLQGMETPLLYPRGTINSTWMVLKNPVPLISSQKSILSNLAILNWHQSHPIHKQTHLDSTGKLWNAHALQQKRQTMIPDCGNL